MKKIKTILFSVAIVCVSLFLCSAGCQNAADSGSSGGGSSSGGGTPPISVTGDEATATAAINSLNTNSPMLNITLTGVTSILSNLRDALQNVPYGKINLDLSQTQITSIGDNAFEFCFSLTSVNIPSGVTSIGEGAFQGCDSLTSVNIPSGVTVIGDLAFYGCESLTSVNIPSGVTTIGEEAFASCESLTSVNIPSSVTSIGDYAFNLCTSLAAINVDTGNNNYSSDNGILYNKAKTILVACPGKKTNVNIPSSVTSIGESAFSGCHSLTSVTIPSSVTSIGAAAFSWCISLASVNIPSGVTTIGNSAFFMCRLANVYVKAATPPSLGNGTVFSPNISGLTIYVPAGSLNAYKAASGWKDYDVAE